MLIALLILSTIINIILIYGLYNLYRKYEIYEKWVSFFGNEIENIYTTLKIVDDKNLFEKDEDVGFVFSEILRIISEFNTKIK